MLGIFLDTEATGLDPLKHRAIDIAFQIIEINTFSLIHKYQSIIKIDQKTWDCHDPASIEVCGYSWEQVQTGKTPELVRQDIIDAFQSAGIERGKAVFICQNPAFDKAFFTHLVDVYTQEKMRWPYHWLDFASMYWALLVHKSVEEGMPFPSEICLSKNAIAHQFSIPPEECPHRAANGVEHLIMCYKKVVGINHSLQASLDYH